MDSPIQRSPGEDGLCHPAIVKQLQKENTATKAEAREARQMAKELKEGGVVERREGGQEEGERRED